MSDAPAPRKIALLGSTGSIGTQTLDIVRRLGGERARVVAVAARQNAALVAEQAQAFGASYAAVTEEAAGPELSRLLSGTGAKAGWGLGTLSHLAVLPEADTVVVAVAGAAGIEATIAACEAGKRVCIATKEVLVAAGDLVRAAAKRGGAEILPIDSEHSAVFQCVQGLRVPEQIAKLYLTGSGGPFRTWPKEKIETAAVADALKHPTWRMGGKITIDSATLMNKGLEIIEACHLFSLPIEKVDVVIHPQSVVHSMVETTDGALLAQLGMPDMRLPIQIALVYPDKPDTDLPRLDPFTMGPLAFEPPDHERFPAIGLARRAWALGGCAPAMLNGANEAAVGLFLGERIGFGDICRLLSRTIEGYTPQAADTLAAVQEADGAARRFVGEAAKTWGR